MTNQPKRTATVKMSVILDRCLTVFIEGELPGVIATQNVTFEATSEYGVQQWQIADMLERKKKEFLDSIVNVKFEYVPND